MMPYCHITATTLDNHMRHLNQSATHRPTHPFTLPYFTTIHIPHISLTVTEYRIIAFAFDSRQFILPTLPRSSISTTSSTRLTTSYLPPHMSSPSPYRQLSILASWQPPNATHASCSNRQHCFHS
eukprot:1770073-Amphidinium_carterae.1